MKRFLLHSMRGRIFCRYLCLIGLVAALCLTHSGAAAQSGGGHTIRGVVYEQDSKGVNTPLPYAVVGIAKYSVYTTTDRDGSFSLSNIPAGNATLLASSLGKVDIDTLINVVRDMRVTLVLLEENFRLSDVTVTATPSAAGQSSSSIISRNAIDHMQATSLKDVLSLLPGALMDNQNLVNLGKINLRGIGSTVPTSGGQATGEFVDMNAMGVSIIQDGSPISNNANMQAISSSFQTSRDYVTLNSPGGGAGPTSGVDARSISTDNIESVEVIQGIPSAEYGDVTSGVIIVNSRAGRSPLRFSAKTNPNVYQFSANAGYSLGEGKGALNFGADYAKSSKSLIQSYATYERTTAKVLYSNTLFEGRWRTNTTVDLLYGRDRRKPNPDDERTRLSNGSTDKGIKLTTNGTLNFENSWWLRNIRYVASAGYTARDSYREQLTTASDFSYSATTTDGATVSNRPGQVVYDIHGNMITNFGPEDAGSYALYMPSGDSYLYHYDIKGREVNIFGKLSATFLKNWGRVNNRILVGLDGNYDGNEGDGKTFDRNVPLPRSISQPYASYRPRRFKDVPYMKRAGAFIEDNFQLEFGGGRRFIVQAGLRYDKVSGAGDLLAPRINASVDIIPRMLSIRGGYGVAGKMPTLMHVYPEKAYFEIPLLNTMVSQTDPENQYYVATTRVFNSSNPELEIAKNKKMEIGFDLRYKQYRLSATAFRERMDNGYRIATTMNTFRRVTVDDYRMAAGTTDIELANSWDMFLQYSAPTNTLVANTDGVEFNLDLGRFDAIRTAFTVNGAWMRTETYHKDYTYFTNNSMGAEASHVGIYDKNMRKRNYERMVTAVRATHNIPELGFVITLTAQLTLKEADWYRMGNDSIPIAYISKHDGLIRDFPYRTVEETRQSGNAEFTDLLNNPSGTDRIKESYSPLVCFNINVTKEIGDFMRVSFFANNMFRNYPVAASSRNPASFVRRNPKFFFGLELSLTIR